MAMEPPTIGAEELLIITGSMGSGKSTVRGAATDLLTLRGIPHAAIDLDTLGIYHLPIEVDGSERKALYVYDVYDVTEVAVNDLGANAPTVIHLVNPEPTLPMAKWKQYELWVQTS